MKKVLSFLAVAVLATGVSFGQSSEVAHQAATFNIFGPIINYYGGSYELGLTDHVAIKGELGFSPNLAWVTGVGMLNAKAEGRYYFSEAVDGWYVSAAGMASTFWGEMTTGSITNSFSGFLPGAGAYVGGKWIFSKKDSLFLEPFFGYEFYLGSISVSAKDTFGNKTSANATLPTIGGVAWGIGFGWAF